MVLTDTINNVSGADAARMIAALAANLPPPEEIKPHTLGALCRHARDTGESAFANLPCRGNRVECAKTGVVTYAARCRSDIECKYYDGGENENIHL